MNAPHLIFDKKHSIVMTAPMCEADDHDECPGGGTMEEEFTGLFFLHLVWRTEVSCGCVCHFMNEHKEIG